MRHSNITATRPIDNQLVSDKDISLLNMEKSISEKSSVKASAAKPSVKPPPGDKYFGIDPDIRFYEIEDGDETEKENNQKSLSFTTQALRHLSKTSSRGSFVISIRSIMKDPWLLTQCAI